MWSANYANLREGLLTEFTELKNASRNGKGESYRETR
jgi:hypothetical protein